MAEAVTTDINVEARHDVTLLDKLVNTTLTAAENALQIRPVPKFSAFENLFFINVVHAMGSSHRSVRKILVGGHDDSSVDALVIARLQVESLYNACYLSLSPEHLRDYLRDGWRKQYVRFLLEREESKNLPRADEFYLSKGPDHLEKLREASFISDEQKAWIDFEELRVGAAPKQAPIARFPGPADIIDKVPSEVRPMLMRLYPEYRYLCSFAHGLHLGSSFRTLVDPRSPLRHVFEPWKSWGIGQHQIAEPAVFMSCVSCVIVATEVYSLHRSDLELAAHLTKAWEVLVEVSLLGKRIWSLRARQVLGAI